MITKLKICSVCHFERPPWISSPPMCRNCSGLIKSRNKAKQATLTQTENGKEAKYFKVERKPIKKVSDKMTTELRIYRKKRDKYFAENPTCEYPGCGSKNITLHHLRGRCGALLTDETNFCSLCMKHHNYVENNPEEGRKLNLVLNRL